MLGTGLRHPDLVVALEHERREDTVTVRTDGLSLADEVPLGNFSLQF